eukprot:jgi/Mesvir1/220/Mv13566-RA.1
MQGLDSTIGANMTLAQIICFLNTFTAHILASLFAGVCHASWLSARLSRPRPVKKPATPTLTKGTHITVTEDGRVVLHAPKIKGTLDSRRGGSPRENLSGPARPAQPVGRQHGGCQDSAPIRGLGRGQFSTKGQSDPSLHGSTLAARGCGIGRDPGRWPLLQCALAHWAVTAALQGAAVAFFCAMLVATGQRGEGRGGGARASSAFTPKFYYLLFELLQTHACGLLFHVAPSMLLPYIARRAFN